MEVIVLRHFIVSGHFNFNTNCCLDISNCGIFFWSTNMLTIPDNFNKINTMESIQNAKNTT